MSTTKSSLSTRKGKSAVVNITNKSEPLSTERIALKIKEAADAIGVNPITIRRMIKRGLLTPYRGLRTPLIPVVQLQNLVGGLN